MHIYNCILYVKHPPVIGSFCHPNDNITLWLQRGLLTLLLPSLTRTITLAHANTGDELRAYAVFMLFIGGNKLC